MKRFCIFAGTTEGRELTDFLRTQPDVSVTVCVATDYGEALLPPSDNVAVRTGRLTAEDMTALLSADRYDLVLDATHPYAAAVTENIRRACAETGTACLRLLRAASDAEGAVYVPDPPAAADYLDRHEGNVLLTTGSKELGSFSHIRGFADRVWARVLPMASSLESCAAAGLPPAHILALQGPFSRELNEAMLRAINARYLVTKDGGGAGGFAEKAAAAENTGARLIVIGRPPEREGRTLPETITYLCRQFGFAPPRPEVIVAGIGPGALSAMTGAVRSAIDAADCLIGAQRMLDAVAAPGQPRFSAVAPERIADVIRTHGAYRRFTVLMSGDTGFFSGAKKLLPLLNGCDYRVLPGLSSLSYLCARLGVSYEDALTVSLHGRDRDIARDVRSHGKVFVLVGGENGAGALCRRLTEAGLGGVRVSVGQRLSYPDEHITTAPAAVLAEQRFDSLSAVLIENDAPDLVLTPGWPDDAFRRVESVPMTKSEVRAVCLSKLRLTEAALCWDIGAGTGSVSAEMAGIARNGTVYAVERSDAALEALRANAARLAPGNLNIVPGAAPEACRELPPPTHVFLGGTGGQAREIIALALEKNPAARIVATALTLESVAELTACGKEFGFDETEAVCLTVARDRKAGPYHLMLGQNPIYIFTLQKRTR